MVSLSAWQTLLFLIPLLTAVVLVGGLAFGFGDGGDGDADADGDTPGHADHVDGALSTAKSLLGIGRVPLTVVLLSLSLSFGTTGLASNALLHEALPRAYGFVSLVLAAFAALAFTALVTRTVARVLPSRESYLVRKDDLVGGIGRAIVEISPTDGFLQVTDHEGNLHQVRGRTSAGTVPKGTRLVLVDRRHDGDWYLVEPLPRDEADPPAPARVTVR